MTTVTEWITDTQQKMERQKRRILYDSELEKILSWQATGWMAGTFESAMKIADIQLQFTQMLLRHAIAIKEQREELQKIVHIMDGEV